MKANYLSQEMERAGGDEGGKMGTNNTYTPPPPLTDQEDKAAVVGGLSEFDALLSTLWISGLVCSLHRYMTLSDVASSALRISGLATSTL